MEQVYVFLFNDMLLISRETTKHKGKLRATTALSITTCTDVKLEGDLCFDIDSKYLFVTSSDNERKMWSNHLNKVCWQTLLFVLFGSSLWKKIIQDFKVKEMQGKFAMPLGGSPRKETIGKKVLRTISLTKLREKNKCSYDVSLSPERTQRQLPLIMSSCSNAPTKKERRSSLIFGSNKRSSMVIGDSSSEEVHDSSDENNSVSSNLQPGFSDPLSPSQIFMLNQNYFVSPPKILTRTTSIRVSPSVSPNTSPRQSKAIPISPKASPTKQTKGRRVQSIQISARENSEKIFFWSFFVLYLSFRCNFILLKEPSNFFHSFTCLFCSFPFSLNGKQKGRTENKKSHLEHRREHSKNNSLLFVDKVEIWQKRKTVNPFVMKF